MKLKLLLLFALSLYSGAFAQLANFNLLVTKTDETCLGNGALSISTTNVAPGASLLFKIYKQPNVTTPLVITSNTFISSLTSGTYKVVAIQALGNQSNTQEKSITINNSISEFNYTISSYNQNCAAGGNIVINASSGIPAAYEIISGPEIRPLQSSNVFVGLPGGAYNIRVYNNCGVAKVKTYTLSLITSVLNISDASYPDGDIMPCDSIKVSNLITPSAGSISYPVAVQYTLNPLSLSGEAIVISQSFETGDNDSLEVSAVMPRYFSESYTYDLRVTDNCNTTYERLANVVDPTIGVQLSKDKLKCANRALNITPSKHKAPYTVEFVEAPAGFTAAAYNAAANGPFNTPSVVYGEEGNAIPFGNYVVKITDACGRTAQDTIMVDLEPLVPTVSTNNNGCFSLFGRIRISIDQQIVVTAVITAAPNEYTAALPQVVTGNINSAGMLVLTDMPIGTYKITITDDCGFTYDLTVVVPPFVEQSITAVTLPDCTPQRGTAKIRSGNGDLVSVIINSAPSTFGQALPYDVSANIYAVDGDFYINNLPEGMYTFTATDICGIVGENTLDVKGYDEPVDSFAFAPNCGTFSVTVTDTSNGTHNASYWLQRYNPELNAWGKPGNGNLYPEGTVPTTTNSIVLTNEVQRNNLPYFGKFRIVKKFETYGNGTSENTICLSVLGEFDFIDAFAINNVYTLACAGTPNDVYLEAVGYITSYKIEKKNGAAFVIDNGVNNIFSNLEPATYLFSIEDNCGNKLTKEVNLRELPSVANAIAPSDMHICVEEASISAHTFHLTDQNAAILGSSPAALYTITYHMSQQDADNGLNPLPEYYTNISNGQTVYARVVNNHIAICHATTSFALYIGDIAKPEITTTGTICNDGMLTLTANAGFSNYLWSTGETTRTILVKEPGIYTVVVEQEYGDRVCDGSVQVEVFASSAPHIVEVDTEDWSRGNNTIAVTVSGTGAYEYSIDGVNYQESNVFDHMVPGVYTVYVKDANGCGTDTKEVVLMNYPNFFTPNGDGFRDKWRVEYSVLEPHFTVSILDRYGKIVTSFDSKSEGWDGTLNGAALPSTDYWFIVNREDGRELRGHFAMLR